MLGRDRDPVPRTDVTVRQLEPTGEVLQLRDDETVCVSDSHWIGSDRAAICADQQPVDELDRFAFGQNPSRDHPVVLVHGERHDLRGGIGFADGWAHGSWPTPTIASVLYCLMTGSAPPTRLGWKMRLLCSSALSRAAASPVNSDKREIENPSRFFVSAGGSESCAPRIHSEVRRAGVQC